MDDQLPQEPRRRLGRGLSALLGSTAGADLPEGASVAGDQSEIHIELIERNPFQPRKDFDQAAINELVDSIRVHGVLQPLLVRQAGDGYQLIAGERRLISAKKAGLQSVPCRVLQLDDQQVSEVALEENLKRQDLNVLEKAIAFDDYIKRYQCPIEELAKRLSLDRSTVSNMLRLLELPEAIKDDLRTNRISAGHARSLLPLCEADQLELAKRIQRESLSVRKTEEAVRAIQQANEADAIVQFPGVESGNGRGKPLSNHLLSIQDQLRDLLQAKVEIKLKGKDAGRITIDFANNDEFERLLVRLRSAA